MRWSWSSFGAGLVGGALLAALLWLATSEPDDRPRTGRSENPADRTPGPRRQSVADGETQPGASKANHVPSADDEESTAAGGETTGSMVQPRSGRERTRVTPTTTEPTTPAVSTSSAVVNRNGVRVLEIGEGKFRVSFSGTSVNSQELQWLSAVHFGVQQPAAQAMLTWARQRAADAARSGAPSDSERAALQRGDTYQDRAAGLGLALAATPPAIDELLAIARDPAYPDLRGAALLAAAEADIEHRGVRDLVLELSLDGDGDLRRAATDLLPRLGEAGGRRAAEILLRGDYTQEVIGSLTMAVAHSDAVGEFLSSEPPSDAALRVIQYLSGRLTTPQSDADRSLAAAIPNLVRPLLETPQAENYAATILPQLAGLGHGAFLRGIAAAPMYRSAVRAAAATAALGNERTRDEGVLAAAAILSDPNAEVGLVRTVLGGLDASLIADPTLRSALASAADDHPSAWVRTDARNKLSEFAPDRGGTLVLHEAEYGIDDGWVDVLAELRAGVRQGSLRIQASNGIAGDPKEGHVKVLRVEYTLDGVRRLARITEGQWLRIP